MKKDYPSNWRCPNCKTININRKTCKKCRFKYDLHYPRMWHCPECNALIENSTSCLKCSYPKDLHYPSLWHCSDCGKLIKSSTKCPYCKKKKVSFKLSKKIIIPLIALLLVFIVFVMPKPDFDNSDSNIVLNISGSGIILPDWTIIEQTNTSIKLYDEDSLHSIFYFTNPPIFSQVRTEVNNLYSQIEDSFTVQVISEYTYFDWEVICFSNDLFQSCLSAIHCNNTIFFIQYTDYSNNLNQSSLLNLLDSFCCNC